MFFQNLCKNLISQCLISEHLETDIKVSSTVTFNVNISVLKSLFIGSDIKYLRTILISHIKQYLGFGDILL